MSQDVTPIPGPLARMVDEQLELAAARLPALAPGAVHPSPADHQEVARPHPTLEDVLLGHAAASEEMLDELAAFERAPELEEDDLARQALQGDGAAAVRTTPE